MGTTLLYKRGAKNGFRPQNPLKSGIWLRARLTLDQKRSELLQLRIVPGFFADEEVLFRKKPGFYSFPAQKVL